MLRNLWIGLKLCLLVVPADTKKVRTGDGAVWFSFLALLLSYIFYSWLYLTGPAGGFARDGFLPFGYLIGLSFLGLFLLRLLLRPAIAQADKIFVLILNTNFWITFVSEMAYLLAQDRISDEARGQWMVWIGIWQFIVCYKIILTESAGAGWREFAGAVLFPLLFCGAFKYFDAPEFVNEKYDREAYYKPLNAEEVFALQPALLDRAFATIKPSAPGHRDSYLIAVGPDAYQDVFRKEALFAKGAFDATRDTTNRSLVLANSRKSVHTLPAATLTNLDAALQRLGKMIQPGEDALILYLTSHGSDDASLETQLPGVSLKDFTGPALRTVLDRSRFRWRVVVISACYSGSFIEPLQDDNTLIITASSADRNSFGCSDTADLTYFGEAFLKDALPATRSLPDAYLRAKGYIAERERQEHDKPSLPQIFIGKNMKTYLEKR